MEDLDKDVSWETTNWGANGFKSLSGFERDIDLGANESGKGFQAREDSGAVTASRRLLRQYFGVPNRSGIPGGLLRS